MYSKRKENLLNLLSILMMVIAVAMAFAAGYLVRDRRAPVGDLPILRQANEILRIHGYNDLPPDPALEYGMVRGMLQAYNDPYTYFNEPVQFELSSQNLEGRFGGIGVTLTRDADNFPVLHPIADGPAAKAGVLDGDRLVQVDELIITGETATDQIVAAVRGPIGSKVTLGINRPPDNQSFDFTMERQEIALPSVIGYIETTEPRIGVLKINIIAATTSDELIKNVLDLQQRGATNFILDLRDNSGGLLDSGVEAARLFLADGIVMVQQYKGQAEKAFEVNKRGQLADLPLVVLVNKNTASAAEIIAGAIQAHKRAPLIGTDTFGKDTIQLVFELKDGSSLNVTAAHWWVPGIPKFGGLGLQPDTRIAPEAEPTSSDPFIQAAITSFFH
jgi:carboxyl-terminal processing protease